MIPLSDSIKSRRFPIATLIVLALNIYVFFLQLTSPDIEQFINRWGFTPQLFSLSSPDSLITILTSMFMHGGFLHIISNMLFLWVFADNIEDALGSIKFILFYLLSGVGAVFAQYLAGPESLIPMIGASGAVAGVLAAYWKLYPKATIHTLIPIGFFITSADIPASLMIGFWFIIQVFSGYAAFNVESSATGGIAFFAHIGGFLTGLLLITLFPPSRRKQTEILKRLW